MIMLGATLFYAASCGSAPDAQRIIDQVIENHGGVLYENFKASFDFRGRHYVMQHQGGSFQYERHFSDIGKRFGPIDISLLPIGAYLPRWFMKPQHLNPEDAVKAHRDLLSKKSMGIHFGTFKLSDEGVDDPELDLTRARAKHKIPSKDFIVPKFGQTLLID